MLREMQGRSLALAKALRKAVVDWLDEDDGTDEDCVDAVHVLLGQAADLTERFACCDGHHQQNLDNLAKEFTEFGQRVHAERNTQGTCPPDEPSATVSVRDKGYTATPEAILASPDPHGIVVYAGQVFGPQGLRPLFMLCLHRAAFEKMVADKRGFDVDIEMGGHILNIKTFGRESREECLEMITSRTMTEEQEKAVVELQTATKQ